MPRALAGRYRLERRLGSGGMGKVYEAVDEALARRVAVNPPFLVMELLEGATLREELEKTGRLVPGRAVEVLRGVCSAVEAAHRHHLVHRDLKPENIFLAAADDGQTVRILDFGVAKLLDNGQDAGGQEDAYETEAGVLVGTVGYMSPEQLLGGRPASAAELLQDLERAVAS